MWQGSYLFCAVQAYSTRKVIFFTHVYQQYRKFVFINFLKTKTMKDFAISVATIVVGVTIGIIVANKVQSMI